MGAGAGASTEGVGTGGVVRGGAGEDAAAGVSARPDGVTRQDCRMGLGAIAAGVCFFFFFFFNVPATPEIYTLSLHDALPI